MRLKFIILFIALTLFAFSYNLTYAQSCFWHGRWVQLQHIGNVTVEGFRDAKLVGQCKLNAPSYTINGEMINVWEAPNEYPGQLLVHNGDQGPQSTYQTWIMQTSAPLPGPTCFWHGQEVPLQHISNVTVEGFRDAQLVGQCKLNAPSYCINGEYVNVWKAPNEYPGQLLVHNGNQGPQCTYQTWIMQ